MTFYAFDPHLAITEAGQPSVNAPAFIYAYADSTFSTALAVYDLAEVEIGSFRSSDLAVFPAIKIEDEPIVYLVSGTYIAVLASSVGLRDEAVAARAAAESAQLAAEDAATRAEAAQAAAEDAAAGSTGGGGGSGNGNILAIDWDGVTGSQPTRVYPSWHPLDGLTIPDYPDVVVRWRQPVFPTGVAQNGDEYLRTGS